MTRYLNLRKYAEQDPEIELRWAPVAHYTPPDMPSRLRFLPEPLFMRARVVQQAWPLLNDLASLDAVMIHLFEADIFCSLRSYLHRAPIHVSSTDEAPITNRAAYPLYPSDLTKPVWRQKLRLAIDMWRVRHTDLFIPFSHWAANILVSDCGAPNDRVYPLHVGLDLDLWHCPPRAPMSAGARLRSSSSAPISFARAAPCCSTSSRSAFVREPSFISSPSRRRRMRARASTCTTTSSRTILVWRACTRSRTFWSCPRPPTPARLGVHGSDGDAAPRHRYGHRRQQGTRPTRQDGADRQDRRRRGTRRAAIERLLDDAELRRAMGERGRELVESKHNARINVPWSPNEERGGRTAQPRFDETPAEQPCRCLIADASTRQSCRCTITLSMSNEVFAICAKSANGCSRNAACWLPTTRRCCARCRKPPVARHTPRRSCTTTAVSNLAPIRPESTASWPAASRTGPSSSTTLSRYTSASRSRCGDISCVR